MRSPIHLWSGRWREESERARRAAAEAHALRQTADTDEFEALRPPAVGANGAGPRPAAGQPRLAGRRAGVVIAILALLAIAGGAFTAGTLLERDNQPPPLPAVSTAPVKPKKGQSPAEAVYAAASPAVVSVRTAEGAGTGFLIDRKGNLVTNAHVAGNDKRVTVRFGDGASISADVLGSDPSSDLAVLSIEPTDVPRGVKPLQFADSRTIGVGEAAIAIGNPFGLDRTATEGIVSGLGREIQAPNGFSIDAVIQTDAPINPGNSGGPLLDDSGRVIGVNSQIATSGGGGGNVGVGFAVPSNTVREVVPRLERGESIKRAYLGVESAPASLVAPTGAEVHKVVSGGPADDAGVEVGDVIKRVDGKVVNDPTDVSGAIAGKRPGDKIDLEVERDGTRKTLHVKLGTRPSRTP